MRDDLTAALADYDRWVALEADTEPLLAAQVHRLLEEDGGEDALPAAEEGLAGAPDEGELLLSRADAFEDTWEPLTGLGALAAALDVAPEVTKLHLANARRHLERDVYRRGGGSPALGGAEVREGDRGARHAPELRWQ